ncbi:MAG: NAD(P)H-dependent oxidoreductase subunit E [Bacteroidales bacterium]|nr:NAD(P)H-dependent oxidoreductase subunit E [Bacteroidales bacterium]
MRVVRYSNQKVDEPTVAVDLSDLHGIIEKYKYTKGNIIPLLQSTQALFGYIPREAFELISQKTGHALSKLYGVATFMLSLG